MFLTFQNLIIQVELNKTKWVLPQWYNSLRPLGEGAYGVVWLVSRIGNKNELNIFSTAEYEPTGDRVAIKKFFRPFQSTIHAKRTYRELKLLRTLQHDNVLEMIDVFTPDPDATSLNNV